MQNLMHDTLYSCAVPQSASQCETTELHQVVNFNRREKRSINHQTTLPLGPSSANSFQFKIQANTSTIMLTGNMHEVESIRN